MRPLHRIAEWEPHPVRVPVIICLLTWAAVGGTAYWSAVIRVTPADGGFLPLQWLLTMFVFIAAIVQSLRLLWKWEEAHPEPSRMDLQDRIAELEQELGL